MFKFVFIKLYLKLLFILFLLFLYNDKTNSLVIPKQGDYIFAYFSDVVYNTKHADEYLYMSIDGDCHQFKYEFDYEKTTRILISKDVLSNTIVVSFKGTDSLQDFFTDINLINIDCPFKTDRADCGKMHKGFEQAYMSIRKELDQYLNALDNVYDIYLTGHSLGGSLATIALVDLLARPANDRVLSKVKSLNLITFGQPSIGDSRLNAYLNNKTSLYSYRRYVNTADNGKSNDPVPSMTFNEHPNQPITLPCRMSCPSSLNPLGLHGLDLYLESLMDPLYSICRTDCEYVSRNGGSGSSDSIYRNQIFRCTVNKESELSLDVRSAKNNDKYALCLMDYARYKRYDYKAGTACNVPVQQKSNSNMTVASISTNPFNKTIPFNHTGGDYYVVIENHNRILSGNFVYHINFFQRIEPPTPPTILSIVTSKQSNDNYSWEIVWKAPAYLGNSFNSNDAINSTIKYHLYLSPISETWKHFTFTEKVSTTQIKQTIKDVRPKSYAVIVVADNSVESHPSNIYYVNDK